MANPYQPPKAPVDHGTAEDSGRVEKIAAGQKMVIYSIVINFFFMAMRGELMALGILVGLAALVLAIIGVIQIGSGMEFSTTAKVVLVVLMFVPLVNLIALIVLNVRATSRLREAGYKVGLFGASRP